MTFHFALCPGGGIKATIFSPSCPVDTKVSDSLQSLFHRLATHLQNLQGPALFAFHKLTNPQYFLEQL